MIALLAAGCLILNGCAALKSEKAFEGASGGMSKADIVKRLGHPTIIRGAIKNQRGETVEVWEYKVGKGKDFEQVMTETAFTGMTLGAGSPILFSAAETDRYWVYFFDGKFAGWGRAGIWEKDADKIRRLRPQDQKEPSHMI
jgi:hypothetical protein